MTTVTLSSKGQLVIPKALRKHYHLKAKSRMACIDTGRGLFLAPVADDPLKITRGFLKGGPSLTDALLADRRKERAREERKFRKSLR